jgi:hypothetical protein
MYRFRFLPLQEEEFHHGSLLMVHQLGPLDVHFDMLMKRPVSDQSVRIKQGMGIQMCPCYDQGLWNPVQSRDRRGGHYFLHLFSVPFLVQEHTPQSQKQMVCLVIRYCPKETH